MPKKKPQGKAGQALRAAKIKSRRVVRSILRTERRLKKSRFKKAVERARALDHLGEKEDLAVLEKAFRKTCTPLALSPYHKKQAALLEDIMRVGGERAEPFLLEIMKKKYTVNPQVRTLAMFHLGDIGTKKAISALIERLNEKSFRDVLASLMALEFARRKEAIPAIMQKVSKGKSTEYVDNQYVFKALNTIVKGEKEVDSVLAAKLRLVEKHFKFHNDNIRTLVLAAITSEKRLSKNFPTDLNDKKQRIQREYFFNFQRDLAEAKDEVQLRDILGFKPKKKK